MYRSQGVRSFLPDPILRTVRPRWVVRPRTVRSVSLSPRVLENDQLKGSWSPDPNVLRNKGRITPKEIKINQLETKVPFDGNLLRTPDLHHHHQTMVPVVGVLPKFGSPVTLPGRMGLRYPHLRFTGPRPVRTGPNVGLK